MVSSVCEQCFRKSFGPVASPSESLEESPPFISLRPVSWVPAWVLLYFSLKTRSIDTIFFWNGGFQQGKYFICRGYICIFVSAWLCWLAITLPFVLLLSSAIYQKIRHQEGAQPVWKREVARFEYFWPGERAKKSFDRQRRSRISPRVLPSDLTTTTNEKFGTTPRGSMDPSHFPQSDNPSLPHEA